MKHTVARAAGLATLLAGLAAVFPAGCDSTASIAWFSVKFERLQVISAVPTVDEGGQQVATCNVQPGETVSGFELAFALEAGGMESRCDGAEDQDRAIRPGDSVDRARVLPENVMESLDLSISCVEPLPDPSIPSNPAQCDTGTTGATNPNVNPEVVDWRAFTEQDEETGLVNRCEPAAVVLLIEQSGSTRGYLAEYDDVNGLFREQNPNTRPGLPTLAEREQFASDPQNVRYGAAVQFIERLNKNDKLAVFGFRESDDENITALCDGDVLPEQGDLAGQPEYVRKGINCFGINRDPFTGNVSFAYGREDGRTPLWEAVQGAYDFLQTDWELVDVPQNRHIVVITDGPDTCARDSEDASSVRDDTDAVCSDVSYEEVKQAVLAGNTQATADGSAPNPVHIHFVQIQSYWYPEQDARQQELSCLTQGHHIFVNRNDFRNVNGGPEKLKAALEEALVRIRYSLSGYWTMRLSTPSFDANPGQNGFLAPGNIFTLAGTMTVQEGLLRSVPDPYGFDASDVSGDGRYGRWDQRVAFRVACDSDAQCTGGTTPNPCMIYCSEEQHVCLENPIARPDLDPIDGVPTTCTMDDGTSTGQCCSGVCTAGACD